ncbi:deoxyribose-phosphate aldolase [Heliobacterium gestii]|uniref:Deoxyribose-phosphate aldolase n=1 Tax=Heliomicrobium gestii TaxID=2699 RepID=A0A845LBS7_HELGE|nr:deoxyribose-phosphate aldolase [Heliomicrobium gestii]MBM7867991.1 deoxyribose-phosphate aldolase [Heliomicrobium gestii]MZP44257.1 deoxyribose-phosphate aldolase [Heliomicrobium gestii]
MTVPTKERWTRERVAAMIDHTLLKPDAGEEQISALCREAAAYGFASVCVNPVWVETCAVLLQNSPVKVATVIGFPLGASYSRLKAFEAKEALKAGAEELDMVINLGWAKMGRWDAVEADIAAVVLEARRHPGVLVKVILETSLLTDEQIVAACHCALAAGADYVKTSTGFGPGGAAVEHVSLMAGTVGTRARVKASGGIRTAETALRMLEAGADRLGTSASMTILDGLPSAADCPPED